MLPNTGFGFSSVGNGLPYPADNLVRNPIQVNPNNPPYVPNVQCTPEMQQYVPFVAGTCINLISGGAQQNHLRAFTFNQLSENNFANQAFATLVATVVNMVMYHAYVLNQGQDVQGLIQQCANKGLELFIATNVMQFQGLQQYLDQSQMQQIQGLLNELNQYKNAIGQMLNQLQQSQFGNNQFINNSFGGFGINQRPGFNGQSIAGNSGGSSVFNTNLQSNAVNNNQSNFDTSQNRFTNRFTAPVIENEPVHQIGIAKEPVVVEQKVEVQSSKPEPVNSSSIRWSRSDSQAYPPIIKFSENELFIENDMDGFTKLSIVKRSEKSLFDYQTHTAISSLRVYPSSEPRLTKEDIEQANKKIIDVVEADDKEFVLDDDPISIVEHEPYTFEMDVNDCLFENEVTKEIQMKANGNGPYPVFKTKGFLAASLGQLEDSDISEIQSISNAKTIEEFVLKLKASAASLNKRAWKALESRVTQCINHALRAQLALDITIESVLVDYDSLSKLLESKSIALCEAFKSHEKELIKFATNLIINEELMSSIEGGFLSPQEPMDGRLRFLYNEFTVISIDMNSEELDIDVFKDLGSLILQRESKLLYTLAHKVFSSLQDKFFTQVFIRLNDGVALRIDRGMVGNDNFVLTVVRK